MLVVAGGCWRLLAVTGVPVLERFCTHLARNCQLLGPWRTLLISEWFLAVTGGYWRLLAAPDEGEAAPDIAYRNMMRHFLLAAPYEGLIGLQGQR